MHRVAVFIGTRPEAIKMAPVVAAMRKRSNLDVVVVNTGQHRELIDQVIELFDISVDYSLEVMQQNQTLAGLTARLLERIDNTLAEIKPDLVLVQGDTTTVFMGALASFYRQIPVGHVEAGLRTGNMLSPFPEEANRRLVTPLASLHFAPTNAARENLLRESVPEEMVVVTGNTVIDALLQEVDRQKQPNVQQAIQQQLENLVGDDFRSQPKVLITGHRRENFGAGFENICNAIAELAERFTDHLFVYPVHLNPNVQAVVHNRLGQFANVRLISPLPYDLFVGLLQASRLVLTDSGGLQEEAPSLGKPVLVMRDTTERPEGVAAGTAKLVGTSAAQIVAEACLLLEDRAAYDQMAQAVNPYGDGRSGEKIAKLVAEFIG